MFPGLFSLCQVIDYHKKLLIDNPFSLLLE